MQNLIICFGLGIMVAAIIVGIIVFMICRKKEKRVQYYIHSFKDCFREKQDIRLKLDCIILISLFYKIMIVRWNILLVCLMMTE